MAKLIFTADDSSTQEFDVVLPVTTLPTAPIVEVVMDIDPNTTTATVVSATNK